MSGYYNTYLTSNERQFIDKVADIAIKKLRLSPPKYITLREIETAFNETFSTYNSNDHIYEIFDECTTYVLTTQGGVIYNQMNFREAGTDEEIRQKINNALAYELKRWFTNYNKVKLPNQSNSEKAIQQYIDSRKYQDLTDKLPELKGIFESSDDSSLPLIQPETNYIQSIVNIALHRLSQSPRMYISLLDIELAFNDSFPDLQGEMQQAMSKFVEQLTRHVLTKKQSTIYSYMYGWHPFPETPEQVQDLKHKLIDELTQLFKQQINYFTNLTNIPSYQHVDQLIKKYVDNRKMHDLESKLPELKGIFSDL